MKQIFFTVFLLLFLPFGALAVNDVQLSGSTTFELDTTDTSVATTVAADNGGQVTNFDVQSNYVDITLDNLSTVTFHAASGQFLRITKQSGSSDYTVSPTCPTTSATLTGTGVTVVLRLEVVTTNSCKIQSPAPGGGGGGGSSGGGGGGSIPPAVVPSTVPAATSVTVVTTTTVPATLPQVCSEYMTKYIKYGATDNDPEEVKKLQTFLREKQGELSLSVNGVYDQATFDAVKRFQAKYSNDILGPWNASAPTGYVYKTTIAKINSFYCVGSTVPVVITAPVATTVPIRSSKSKSDLSHDGKVNLVDFSIASFWYDRQLDATMLELEQSALNGDGKIDLVDFSIMSFNWTG